MTEDENLRKKYIRTNKQNQGYDKWSPWRCRGKKSCVSSKYGKWNNSNCLYEDELMDCIYTAIYKDLKSKEHWSNTLQNVVDEYKFKMNPDEPWAKTRPVEPGEKRKKKGRKVKIEKEESE